MLFRVVLLWCLDRAMDLVALAQGKPLTSQKRLQPLPAVPISFRAGWWGELHPDDAAQLEGCWQSHAIVDALLLFAPLPCAPSLDVGKFASTTTPRTVRRFIQSAAVNDG